MFKSLFILCVFILFPHAVFAEFNYKIENTNFTISQSSDIPHAKKTYLYNYDRLRFNGEYTEDGFFATLIADGVNYAGHEYVNSNIFAYIKEASSDTPFKTQTSFQNYDEGNTYAKLYRAYGGYEDQNSKVTVGLQNISMGVGRIWTPTNLFNPKNIYALESDETFGVAALAYIKHLNETSDFSIVASQKEDSSFKYAARYKAFLDFTDFAIDAISSDKTKMIGYELEANLADTGIEVRSEGTYIKSTLNKTLQRSEEKEFFQGILGADYGFENAITLVAEALYSSQTFSHEEMLVNLNSEVLPNLVYSNFYLASSVSYSVNIFLDASLLYIESFNDKNSRFVSPNLSYTLNDYNVFSIGAMIYNGENGSEFGGYENTYYFKWVLSF